jgi:DNA-binding NarL/FixJ family response regulator
MTNNETGRPGAVTGDSCGKPRTGDSFGTEKPVRSTTALNILIAARANSFDRSLRSDLKQQGHAVTEATTLIEAISHLSGNRVDLLISDLHLDRSADRFIIEVCRTTCPACKIIASTTWAREFVARDGGMFGVDYFVSATCRPEELGSILNKIAL